MHPSQLIDCGFSIKTRMQQTNFH